MCNLNLKIESAFSEATVGVYPNPFQDKFSMTLSDIGRDPGIDGNTSVSGNPNRLIPPDVYGYSLTYFDTVGKSDY